MSSWHSYPSVFTIGHAAVKDILSVEVNIEEKIDGSQYSWGMIPAAPTDIVHTEHPDMGPLALKVRSKGVVMRVDAPEGMFNKAVETSKELAPLLHPGWTYRAEYLRQPRHNALSYGRIPKHHLILFDVSTGEQDYLTYPEKHAEAKRLGLECVPLLYSGMVTSLDQFRALLDTPSILGEQKIEGVVVKPKTYNLFGKDKKVLMAKFVSEAYKEVHHKSWKTSNPTAGDILAKLGDMYGTPARWNKAIQHLREVGQIEDSPRDIGKLIREIPADVKKECEEEIKNYLFNWAWPHVKRLVTRGAPEYYKEILLKKQFENNDA